jgi:hypothetical protein
VHRSQPRITHRPAMHLKSLSVRSPLAKLDAMLLGVGGMVLLLLLVLMRPVRKDATLLAKPLAWEGAGLYGRATRPASGRQCCSGAGTSVYIGLQHQVAALHGAGALHSAACRPALLKGGPVPGGTVHTPFSDTGHSAPGATHTTEALTSPHSTTAQHTTPPTRAVADAQLQVEHQVVAGMALVDELAHAALQARLAHEHLAHAPPHAVLAGPDRAEDGLDLVRTDAVLPQEHAVVVLPAGRRGEGGREGRG